MITYWNGMAAQLFGLEAGDVLGKSAYGLFVSWAGRKACLGVARTLACSGCYTGEIACQRSSLPPIHADVHARLICAAHGQPEGAVFSIRDISRSKATEQALRDREAHAMRLVESLQLADRCKNHALNVISHELRNPLAAVTMGLALLKRTPGQETQARQMVEMLERQAGQMTRLVDDLLDATRIDANKIKLHKTLVDVNGLLRRILADHKAQYDEKGVSLTAELSPETLVAEADAGRLIQIIGNLLNNAWKFTDRGGEVRVRTARTLKPDEIRITVEDSGIGFAPERLDELFVPFSQIDMGFDRKYGGLGLGLSIVKGLAELHGGRVEASSGGLGRGACFTVILPVPPMPPGERPPSSLPKDA